MMIAKIRVEDLNKLMKVVKMSSIAAYIQVSSDGPKISFSFPDESGKLLTVTLFDDVMSISPTVTRTETI